MIICNNFTQKFSYKKKLGINGLSTLTDSGMWVNMHFFLTCYFLCKRFNHMGKFNFILNDTLDKIGRRKHKNAHARNSVTSHIIILRLKNIFRLKHPLAKFFTRIQLNPF